MGRQPFRQMKSDGTMEDAGSSSGGGIQNWWTHDSTDGFLLVNDGKYSITAQAPFQARGSNIYTQTFNSINTVILHPFIAHKTGTLSKLSIYVQQTTSSGSCTLQIGIYESSTDGYIGDLVGIAEFPNSIKSSVAEYSQTSFQDESGSSVDISLTKGKMYYFGALPKSSTNSSSDVGDGFKLRSCNRAESSSAHGKVTNAMYGAGNGYQCFTFTGFKASESDFTWVQLSNAHKPFVVVEY